MPGPNGIVVPAGSLPRNSAGISPKAQIDRLSFGSAPIPCTTSHTATLVAITA